jgi:hypothetical protein
MRKWLPIALIVVAILWFILTNVGATMALNDLATRPITALQRDAQTVPVQPSGRAPKDGEALGAGAMGVMFGLRLIFTLPDGSSATCTQRFSWLACSDGWQALRQTR